MSTGEQQQLRETLSAIETALAADTDLHTVVLYGSGARGRLRGPGELESDVDVAVAEKAIEMYDYEVFLEPALRAAREARINRVIHGGDRRAVTGTGV